MIFLCGYRPQQPSPRSPSGPGFSLRTVGALTRGRQSIAGSPRAGLGRAPRAAHPPHPAALQRGAGLNTVAGRAPKGTCCGVPVAPLHPREPASRAQGTGQLRALCRGWNVPAFHTAPLFQKFW